MAKQKKLTATETTTLINLLKTRFEKNTNRHSGLAWPKIETKLKLNPEKLWSLQQMENGGGEPDVVVFKNLSASKKDEFIFIDCAAESQAGRRSLCYDGAALQSRKENKPKGSAVDLATAMGVELLTEEEYRALQQLGKFDTKTSSWIQTPEAIRKLGGAVFCDRRFDTVFLYHNGAESYYAGRGFRGLLRV